MKQLNSKKFLLIYVCVVFFSISISAQITITGVVKDKNGSLPGVNVIAKGTSIGTITSIEGNYELTVPDETTTLVYSFIGLQTLEEPINGRTNINITMSGEDVELGEVVVTALGIKKDAKALAYSTVQVGGDDIAIVRDANPINNLSGRTAGVVVNPSGSGAGGSSRVTIRGNSFLSGNNQPLYVIDGVPMDNLGEDTDAGRWGGEILDYGNGLSDINPDDIESISVLKGPAASALYGSRAGSGVVMITTKSGVAKDRLGIDVYSSTQLDVVRPYLEMQNEYGQGSDGVFDPNSQFSWGAPLDGHLVTDWTGESNPYAARDNDIRDYLQMGINTTNTVSFTNVTDKANIRASVAYNEIKGTVPTNNLKKLTSSFRTETQHNQNITSEFKINYTNSKGENRPKLGGDPDNPYRNYIMMPRSISYSDLETNVRNPEPDYSPMAWTNIGRGGSVYNPYFTTTYNTNEDERHRANGYGKLKFELNDWLSVYTKYGIDFYSFRTQKQLGTGVTYWESNIDLSQTQSIESNFENLLRISNDNKPEAELSYGVSAGSNLMNQNSNRQSANGRNFIIPDFYSINNTKQEDQTASQSTYNKSINSVFGILDLAYANTLFMEATFRNDWSSTLPKENRSYFYPSIGLSWVVNQTFDLPSVISFAKIRTSFAEVGNDTDPYQLAETYGMDANGNAIPPDTKFNEDIKSERLQSVELGADIKMFVNRLGIDFTYYNNSAIDQIIKLPVDPSLEGYKYKMINAGNITNKGYELVLYGDIIKNNRFNLGMSFNWAKNINEIVELHPEVDQYMLNDFGSVQVVAEEGGAFGDMYGYTFKRDEQGNLILNDDGLFQQSDERVKVGNILPDWTAGLSINFSYNNEKIGQFRLNVLFDMQKGGDIYSTTQATAASYGTSAITAENGRQDYTITGVDANGNPVTSTVSAQAYWSTMSGISSEWIYDATEINLREITLSYVVPKSFLTDFANNAFKDVVLSFVARNIATFGSNLNGVPPSTYTTSNAQGVESFPSPRTCTLGFNARFSF